MSSDFRPKYLQLLSVLLGFVFLTAASPVLSTINNGFNSSLIEEARKATTPPANYRLRTVVIDAGHGGKDPGGMGANSKEKHIALSVARLLRDRIESAYPEIKVIMTRADDTFIPLFERAAIANRHKADLFISIHANIMPGSKATAGTETFVMGQHVAAYNLDVAKRENASILLEADYETNYDYDPSSDEGHILMAMYQNAFLEQSILFAELVEQQFAGYAGRKSRGVKQAGFVVLKATAMPSVLVETGFMSNPKEEKYLLSDAGQVELSEAIFEAFSIYQRLTDAKENNAFATPSGNLHPVTSQTSMALKKQPVASAPATTAPLNNRQRRRQRQQQRQQPDNLTIKSGNTFTTPVSKPVQATQKAVAPAVLSREVQPTKQAVTKPAVYKQATPATYTTAVGIQAASVVTEQRPVPVTNLVFAVQLAATSRELSMSEPHWQQMHRPLSIIEEDGFFKYQARGIAGAADAKIARDELDAAGFTGAFIVVYHNGKKLTAEQTRQLLNN